MTSTSPVSSWTFLTNHAIVMVCISAEPDMTLRQIATRVGITERAVHRIVTELAADGYVIVRKVGRRNHYEIQKDARLRHREVARVEVKQLLHVLQGGSGQDAEAG